MATKMGLIPSKLILAAGIVVLAVVLILALLLFIELFGGLPIPDSIP